MEMFQNTFKKLGISPSEYEIFVMLYNLGPSSVLQLSRISKLPRTTLYQNLDKLQKQGLVSRIITRKHKLFVAEEIDKLNDLVAQKELHLKNQLSEIVNSKSDINDIINNFKQMRPQLNIPTTEVRYYEGENNIRNVYNDILNHSEIRSYPHAEWISQFMPDITQSFKRAILMNNILTRDIFINKEDISQHVINTLKDLPSYEYKVLQSSENDTFKGVDYAIYGNKIAIIQGPNPAVAVVIENKYMHNQAKVIFDLLWNFLPEIK